MIHSERHHRSASAMARSSSTKSSELIHCSDVVSEWYHLFDDDDDDVSRADASITAENNETVGQPKTQLNFEVALKPPAYVQSDNEGGTNRICPIHRRISGSIDKLVTFNSKVTVFSIPDRFSYDDPENLWMTGREISKMVLRNRLEFAADCWDWRNATEEHDMLIALPMTSIPVVDTVDFTTPLDKSCTRFRPLRDEIRPLHATIRPNYVPIHPIHANPLLAAALRRHIPYPKARSPQGICASGNETSSDDVVVFHHQESAAVCSIECPVARPSSPFVGFDDDDDVDADEPLDNHNISSSFRQVDT